MRLVLFLASSVVVLMVPCTQTHSPHYSYSAFLSFSYFFSQLNTDTNADTDAYPTYTHPPSWFAPGATGRGAGKTNYTFDTSEHLQTAVYAAVAWLQGMNAQGSVLSSVTVHRHR